MNITAITGVHGQLVAIVHAHLSVHDRQRDPKAPHATLRPMFGQKFHEIVAPAELASKPHHELRLWVKKHLDITRE